VRNSVCVVLAFAFAFSAITPCAEAVGKHDSTFIAGTASIAKEATGTLTAEGRQNLRFEWINNTSAGMWEVPYQRVTEVVYSQQIGRGVGSSIVLGVTTLGVGTVPMLLSKKRRHYLAVEYLDDEGAQKTAVFEVGKEAIRELLTAIEQRTGKRVAYQEDGKDERKNAGD